MSEPFDPFSILPAPPHDWQRRAHAEIMPILTAPIPQRERVVLQAATGAGKTWIQMAIIADLLHRIDTGKAAHRARQFRVVLSVPRVALVEQMAAEARVMLARFGLPAVRDGDDWLPPVPAVGEWYTERNTDGRVVIVCHDSLDTLEAHIGAAGLIVAFWMFDEAHRANSNAIVEIRDRLAPKVVLAVTATPFGRDHTVQLRGWDRVGFTYPIHEAIADGVLVPYRCVMPTAEEEAFDDTNAAVISMIRRAAPPGPGVVSASSIDDAEWYAGVLTENGIPATVIHSRMAKPERMRRIAALLRGEYRCVVHVDLLTEGVDIRGLRWLAERRHRKSAVAIVQAAGRILRVIRPGDPTEWAGPKTEAVILLPHPTKLDRSIHAKARLNPSLTAEMYDGEAKKELQGEEKLTKPALPPAQAAVMVSAWLRALPDAVAARGLWVPAPYIFIDQPGTEHLRPTAEQILQIAGAVEPRRKSPFRRLPTDHRELLYLTLTRTEHLTRGDAVAVLRVAQALKAYNSKFYREHMHLGEPACYWTGLGSLPLDCPRIAPRSVKRIGETE